MPQFNRPIKFQASIFTPGVQWGNVASLARRVVAIMPEAFGLHPMPVEIPAEAPAAIPRVLLSSFEKTWQFSVSLERTELVAFPGDADRIEHIPRAEFWSQASDIFDRFVVEMQVEVSRIGAVTDSFGSSSNDDLTPAHYVRNHYFSSDLEQAWFEDMQNAEFHVHRLTTWNSGSAEVRVNQWSRLRAVHLAAGEPSLQLLTDINTENNPASRFSSDEVRAFLQYSHEQSETAIRRIERIE